MSVEIDGIMKSLGNLPGVIGTMIMTYNGLPIRTSFKETESIHYAGLVSEFIRKAKSVIEPSLLNGPPIDVIRIRSNKNEIIIAPDSKGETILIVVQDADAQA